MADGFLFSAGTDTQIIAYEAVKYKPDIPCLTLAFKLAAINFKVGIERLVAATRKIDFAFP